MRTTELPRHEERRPGRPSRVTVPDRASITAIVCLVILLVFIAVAALA